MSMIDYGAILKVNGKFINKNQDLFMESTETGYVCKQATYFNNYENKEDVMNVDGDFYVYAGDEDFMLCFYKGFMRVISHNRLIYSLWNSPFISETIYLDGFPSIKVEHLDKTLYVDPVELMGTWQDYVRKNWYRTTGNEKLSELENGYERYKRFRKIIKANARNSKHPTCWQKYRTNRWIATWDYNGNHYEVIFGYGIDPSEEVWNDIKNDRYDFTDLERSIIDSWFSAEED